MLWLDPSLARGVLTFLARHQATETSAFQDAAPGKIVHETRKGEMVGLRELPFGRYYGGVDTTPLFVMLAGAYATRTGDLAFVDELWPSLRAAMAWIESARAADRDGFVAYAAGLATGLANQGWKDSHDLVFHADGTDAVGPISLVEVQGYAYAAFAAMTELAERRGQLDEAAHWRSRGEAMRTAVEARFWVEDLGYLRLGPRRRWPSPAACERPTRATSCSPGCPTSERAGRVAAQLLAPPFNSGWGIRTLAAGQPRFNPMSYHNGSVWPHDTALCAAGLSRYGEREGVARLVSGLFEVAVRLDMRLPELFCGFGRAAGAAPIAYPVACLPQAWSSGAVFMLLQSCLGLSIDGWGRSVHVNRPWLPVGIDQLTIQRLAVGGAVLDLTFQRVGERVVAFSQGRDPSPVPLLLHS